LTSDFYQSKINVDEMPPALILIRRKEWVQREGGRKEWVQGEGIREIGEKVAEVQRKGGLRRIPTSGTYIPLGLFRSGMRGTGEKVDGGMVFPP